MPKSDPGKIYRSAVLEILKKNEWSVAELAERAGVKANSIYNLIHGRAKALSSQNTKKLADAADVPMNFFMGEAPMNIHPGHLRATKPLDTVRVRGDVEAGAWRARLERDPAEQKAVPMPDAQRWGCGVYGLEVRGLSMDLNFKPGAILYCVPIHEYLGELKSGSKVICQRKNGTGDHEQTVKELVIEPSGRTWLWPRSTQPEHQAPIAVPWPLPSEADKYFVDEHEVAVIAVVVASYENQLP